MSVQLTPTVCETKIKLYSFSNNNSSYKTAVDKKEIQILLTPSVVFPELFHDLLSVHIHYALENIRTQCHTMFMISTN